MSLVPVKVQGIDDATAVSAGISHSCVLHQTGNISCWGNNYYGQLGDGTGDDSSVPVKVQGIDDATAVSAGSWHTCALHQTGQVSCWGGWGGKGLVPVEIDGITDATAIDAGDYDSCALHQTGTISRWGKDAGSVLKEIDGISDATAVDAGGRNGSVGEYFCALHQTGNISCWGRDAGSVPEEIDGISDATAIAVGEDHSCALHLTGNISCWGGNNGYGQLGNNAVEFESSVPVGVIGVSDAVAITAGKWYSCALHQTGNISCWGTNEDGRLGDGTNDYSSVPVKVQGIDDATAVTVGGAHSCALHQTGNISCWGTNDSGQLGDGAGGTYHDYSPVPVKVVGIYDITTITTGLWHSCALHQTGNISCWGNNQDGQLGDGTGGNERDMSSFPVRVKDIEDAIAISASDFHSCALHQTGNISCWGRNWFGQLGDGTGGDLIDYSLVPVKVVGIEDATAVSTSLAHSCALHQNRTISCWGYNGEGQLGDGTGGNRNFGDISSVPVKVAGIEDAIAISAGISYSCALHQNSNISCWGHDSYRWLGDGIEDDSLVPLKVMGIDDATAISAGSYYLCALHQNSTISCWGDSGNGRLGNGTSGGLTDYSSVPVKVVGIEDAIAISAGISHSCVLHQNGTISCWGNNTVGRLGDGTSVRSFLPRFVVGFGG